MRTTRESITFDRPFSLSAVDEVQPAGTYTVQIDEELVEGLSFLAYRRVATTSTCRSRAEEQAPCRPSRSTRGS